MKNIFRNLMLALPVIALVSCEEKGVDYVPAEWTAPANISNVYFEKASYTEEKEPTEATHFEIPVSRREASSALTVTVKVNKNTDNVFTIGTANFEAGSTTAVIPVDFPNTEVGVPYTLSLEIADPNAVSEFSEGVTYTYKVTRVKWVEIDSYVDSKTGETVPFQPLYTDDFVSTFFGVPYNATYPVRVQERSDKPGYFRIINAYHENYDFNGPGDWDDSTDHYIFIDATNRSRVTIPVRCNTGMNWGYGDFVVYSLAGYYLEKNDAGTASKYYGKYANGKITFPKSSLLVGMTEYNDGGLYTSNGTAAPNGEDGMFCLVLNPTLDPYQADLAEDFSWEPLAAGDFESELVSGYAKGGTYLALGTCETTTDDCDKTFAAKYGKAYLLVDPYNTGESFAFAVNEGKVLIPTGYEVQPTGLEVLGEPVFIKINSGKFDEENMVLTVKADFVKEDGTVVKSGTETWKYEPYKEIYEGDYYYTGLFAEDEETPAVDAGLIISQSQTNPNKFKISNWGMGTDFVFYMDDKYNVTVPEQYVADHPNYGPVYTMELADYAPGQGFDDQRSYYDPEEETFYFDVIYYCSAGIFTYGYEYFEVTDKAAAAIKAAVAAKKDKVKINVNLKPMPKSSVKK